MANRHLSYNEFKAIFGDLGITEWVKYNWLDNNFNLPSNLVRVEYLETVDGSYIDTGISSDSTAVEVLTKIEVINTQQDLTIFGCSSSNYQAYHLTPFQNSWYFGTDGTRQSNAGTYSPVVGTVYEIDFNNSGKIFINNVQTGGIYNFKVLGNLLFNGRAPGEQVARYGQYKYYYFKVFVDGNLVRSYIPVFDTDTGKYGLYDLVGRQFYGNAGTGDFTGPKLFRFTEDNLSNIKYYGLYTNLHTFYIDIGNQITVNSFTAETDNSKYILVNSGQEVNFSYRPQATGGEFNQYNTNRCYVFLDAANEAEARQILKDNPIVIVFKD